MASKRIKKKQMKAQQMSQINQYIIDASPYIVESDLKNLAKATKTTAERMETLRTLSNLQGYIAEEQAKVELWRSQKGVEKWGGAYKEKSTLSRMNKYYLLKQYWDLVKKGWIKHDYALADYDDVVDYSLENMSDEELHKVIAEAEGRREKNPMVDFESLSPI